jgi:hypothetical protein
MGSAVISLRIQDAPDGAARHERLPVVDLGDGRYRLINSPGMVLGAAGGDEIQLGDDGDFEVLTRGGNVAVHVFLDALDDDGEVRARLASSLGTLDGYLDGDAGSAVVYTVPEIAGVSAIVGILESITADFPAAVWMFGNVDIAPASS